MSAEEKKEKLKGKLDEMKTALGKAVDCLEGYSNFDDGVESLPEAMRRLADTFDIRLMQLPKEAQYVRMKKVHFAMLSQVLNNWATDLEGAMDELRELSDTADQEVKKLEEASEEFEGLTDSFLELLDEVAPEVDIQSELRDAERG